MSGHSRKRSGPQNISQAQSVEKKIKERRVAASLKRDAATYFAGISKANMSWLRCFYAAKQVIITSLLQCSNWSTSLFRCSNYRPLSFSQWCCECFSCTFQFWSWVRFLQKMQVNFSHIRHRGLNHPIFGWRSFSVKSLFLTGKLFLDKRSFVLFEHACLHIDDWIHGELGPSPAARLVFTA